MEQNKTRQKALKALDSVGGVEQREGKERPQNLIHIFSVFKYLQNLVKKQTPL